MLGGDKEFVTKLTEIGNANAQNPGIPNVDLPCG